MSVTFFVAELVDGGVRQAYRCDCAERWCSACDDASERGEDPPATFACSDCTDVEVNMSNANATEWMRWVGLPDSPDGGDVPARELAALCRRRLWDEPRNHDPAIAGRDERSPGRARIVYGDRRPGYLRDRTESVLRICERAGDRLVAWS